MQVVPSDHEESRSIISSIGTSRSLGLAEPLLGSLLLLSEPIDEGGSKLDNIDWQRVDSAECFASLSDVGAFTGRKYLYSDCWRGSIGSSSSDGDDVGDSGSSSAGICGRFCAANNILNVFSISPVRYCLGQPGL